MNPGCTAQLLLNQSHALKCRLLIGTAQCACAPVLRAPSPVFTGCIDPRSKRRRGHLYSGPNADHDPDPDPDHHLEGSIGPPGVAPWQCETGCAGDPGTAAGLRSSREVSAVEVA